jgi:hypothetical protein
MQALGTEHFFYRGSIQESRDIFASGNAAILYSSSVSEPRGTHASEGSANLFIVLETCPGFIS